MKTTLDLPLLPLRDVVVYPHMVIPLFVGREKSIEALEAAMTGGAVPPSVPCAPSMWTGPAPCATGRC